MANVVVYGVIILAVSLCQTEGTRFKAGESYEYNYEVLTSTGVNSTYAAGIKLSCTFIIDVTDQDRAILQVKKCRVEERSPGKHFTKSEHSDSFSEEISRNAISFHFVDGEVVNHQIVIPEAEHQSLINVKRGIISLLQVPSTARNPTSKSYFQHDIFGGCKVAIKFPEKTENHVQTHRDLVTCRLAHIKRGQSDFMSFIKTLKGGTVLGPITQTTYQFESDVTCDYFMGNYQQLKQARCLQRQAYLPLAHETLNQNTPMTNISQNLKLLSRTKLGSNETMEPIIATQAVDLFMDFSANVEEEYDRNLLERHFRVTMMDVLGQGHDLQTSPTGDASQSFRRLINTMRRMVYDELKPFKDGIFACRNSLLCFKDLRPHLSHISLKSVSEQILTNALMSCGTHACVDILAECLRDQQIGDVETQIVLFNTALFYDPSARFMQNIFELCKINNSTTCLLSLSALLGRLNVSQADGNHKLLLNKNKMIFKVVLDLHKMIEDLCTSDPVRAETAGRDELLLTALKALGNIGTAAHTFYNSLLDEGNKLTDDLLKCLMNKEVNVVVAKTAVQTINKIGLNATICQKLFTLLSDEKRPVVFRASIFDILLFYADGVMLNDLLDLLYTTKMDHMRTYILSRLAGLLEDLNPHHQNLRISLRELLKKRVIPELSDNDFDQSHFTQLSHLFTIPLTSLKLWGSLAFKITYTPTSNLFQSITITADWELNKTTKVNMLEVTVDVSGMDSIIAYLTKSNNIDWSEIFKFLHHTNIHEAKFPQFSHFRQTILKNLQKIFKTSNFQGAEMPQGFLSFKINGLDVGWLSLDSLSSLVLKASKNSPLSLMGYLSHPLDIFFTRAVNVLETQQVLPTAAGLPLDTLIDFNLVFKSIIEKKMNNFGGLKSFNCDFIFKPSVSAFIQRSMQVSLMHYTKSRVSLKSSGLVNLDLSTNFKYQAPESQQVNQNLNPESRRDNAKPRSSSNGEFKIQLLWALGSEQVNFVNIKNDIYLKHNINEIRVVPISREYQYVNCLPDVYTAATGRRVCLTGNYYSPATNVVEGMLSSIIPFRMEGSIVPDDENLKYYLVVASWYRDPGSSSFHIKLVLEGPGTELSRLVNISASTDRFGSIQFECKIPDVEIKYQLERKLFFNSTHHHHRYAVALSQEKKILSSFVFERKGYSIPKSSSLPDQTQVKFDQSSTDMYINLNLGDVSLDLRISGQRPLATYSEKTVLLKYYCEPSLKLLYSLHPAPSIAKNEGHTSSFSYHHEIMDSMTPLEKTWMAFYKVVVIWPGTSLIFHQVVVIWLGHLANLTFDLSSSGFHMARSFGQFDI